MSEKKKIVVFCNKYLGFTLLASGGVLKDLIDGFDVTIITTESSKEGIVRAMGGIYRVETYDFKISGPRAYLFNVIGDVLGMTYARDGVRRNLTGVLHRKAHIKLSEKKGVGAYIRKRIIVFCSEIAEKFKPIRVLLGGAFYYLCPKQSFVDRLKSINPSLCITTTAGLGDDGVFLAAAKLCGIPTLALIQSWDRTASKGYPAQQPDHCIVWNDAMKYEAVTFLEIDKNRVYVEGAPPWDKYLSLSSPLDGLQRSDFFKKWNLNPDKKTVFVAINGPSTHHENIKLIQDICDANLKGYLPDTQVLFRIHPAYLPDHKSMEEIETVFNKLKNDDMHLMRPIVANLEIKNYVVTEDDRIFMHNMFRACDLTVSIMSTWMIESSIFDKPNICIEYGRYKTELYDFDLSEYLAEHIVRIYNYGAVYRVRSPHGLIRQIVTVLKNPSERRSARARLVKWETGPNKGNSRQAFFNKILNILE